ncbi:MAG TPA: endo-1,4-beta-xylanase, partial [Gemmatirosa sp.]
MVRALIAFAAALGIVAGVRFGAAAAVRIAPRDADPPTLRDAYHGTFLVGVAVNDAQASGRDTAGARIAREQFNSVSPENVLKWERVHPHPGVYDWAAADRYVAFGQRAGMFVIGHTLVWHQQTPRWVFEDGAGRPASRDTVLARMREHIHAVVGRYRGRVRGWDVVNEALADDGSLRDSPWRRAIGDDFIAYAFRYAHEADPGAELYYNDYALEGPAKRAGAVALVRRLRAAGVPIVAVGTQEHDALAWPTAAQVDTTIAALAATGVRVNVTELDIDVLPAATAGHGAEVSLRAERRDALDPFAAGLPDSVQHALARRYAELFAVFLKHRDAIARVTFWNVT